MPETDPWPRGVNGRPMMRASFSASELIPTGQYANVAIGPCQVVAFIDVDRELDGDGYFTSDEKETLAQALNELAEVVESDVVAVQRGLVEKSLQSD